MKPVWTFLAAVVLAWPAQAQLSGELRSAGSDTMREVMEAWAEAFQAQNPDVTFEIESAGSNTAPPALTEGRVELAPMSRAMTRDELRAFSGAQGGRPVEVTTALDALAVYVHKDNPVYGLTMEQLDQIFSQDRACRNGRGRNIETWRQVALGVRTFGEMALHGRNELSGTHDYFQEKVLCGGAFKGGVVTHEDSKHVVDAVAADRNAIGYAGLGYLTDAVRTLAIGKGDGFEETRYFPIYVERHKDNPDAMKRHAFVFDGRYPLSRSLFIYIKKPEDTAQGALVRAFLRFALSAEGQKIVEEIGYIPLPERITERQLRKIGAAN